MTEKFLDDVVNEQRRRAAISNKIVTDEVLYINSLVNAGPKRARSVRPYYFQSVNNVLTIASNTLLYYYTDLQNDTLAFQNNATLGNLPTNFLYYGNLYFMVYPPSAQTAAYQVELGCTSYQKNAATIRATQWVRLDAFDDSYNTYPTHVGTLFPAVNGWTRPNNQYEKEKLLFHAAGLRVNTNATGTVNFNVMLKFNGYQIETTEA